MITIEKVGAANLGLLDEQMRTALGKKCYGISGHGNRFGIHLDDSLSDAEREKVNDVWLAHDPAELTAEQAKEATRKLLLQERRGDRGEPLDLDDFRGQGLLAVLAKKVAWLEQELLAQTRLD